MSPTIRALPCLAFMLAFGADLPGQLSLEYAGMHQVFSDAPMSRLSVPQTDQPPPIDGRFSDEVWAKAALASDFVEVTANPHEGLWGMEPAEARTVARLLYDDEHLYLGWRCDEPHMDKLRTEARERDGPVRQDDSVRFVIEMSRGGIPVRVIDIAVNAANVVFDSHTTEGHAAWTVEDLRTAVHHDEDGWQVAMALPFAGLGIAPPKPGETWWINLGRERHAGGGLNRETSYWAAQPQTRFAFHSYKGMGREIRFGDSLALVGAEVPRPFLGSGTVTAVLQNNSDRPRRLDARLLLAPQGDLTGREEFDVPAHGTSRIELPFVIETEGVQIAYLIVEEEGEVIATSRRAAYVPPVTRFVRETIEQFERLLEEAEQERHLEEGLRRELPRLREILQEAEELRAAAVARPISLETEQEWEKLARQARQAYGRSGWFDPPALYLTWMRDPDTTMVVHWHSHDAVHHNTLEFRRAGAESDGWRPRTAWSRPAPHSDRLVHMVELAGLEPDTDYEFRFGPGLEIYKFRTMPATADEPIVFIAGGDTMHRPEWFAQMNRQAGKYEPRFAMIGGDITYADGRPDRVERWYDFFTVWKESMMTAEGRLVPMLMAVGNHEVRHAYADWGGAPKNAPYFFGFFAMPGMSSYNVLDFGDYLSVLLMDTGHTVRVRGEQTEWLDQTLARRRDVPHVFPLLHVSPYPAHFPFDFPWSVHMRNHWVPLFEKHDVEVVFVNHDHVYSRTHPIRNDSVDPTGVVYLGGGAWGVGTLREHPVQETWYLASGKSVRHVYIGTIQNEERHFIGLDIDGNEFEDFTIHRGQGVLLTKELE